MIVNNWNVGTQSNTLDVVQWIDPLPDFPFPTQGRSKVFTTGQAKVNPEHYVIRCVGRPKPFHMAFLSLAVCCSKSIKPVNHFRTLFIT